MRVRRRRTRAPREASRPVSSAWRENLESVLWAVAVALLIRTFLIAPFKIPSGSMRPTLLEGDRILVNKFLYRVRDPKAGEIIVFRFPENPKRPFIKRLAAVGGDLVEIRDGHLWGNGELSANAQVHNFFYYNQGEFGQEDHVVRVPDGMYYVLGDNSSSSHDSRYWGFVPRRLLIGKAVCIFWPPSRLRVLR